MRRALIVLGIVFSSGSLLLAQALFPKPVKVVGDPNFIGTASSPTAFDTLGPNYLEGRELSSPDGIALDTSVSPPILYIADSGNHRVLAYRYATQLVAGSHADLIIGQIDPYTNTAQNPANGGREAGLNNPTGLAVDSAGNLYVADTGNNRILRFPQPFNAANANQQPNLVIGQKTPATSSANFNGIGASTLSTSGQERTGIAFDAAGNLWVADTGNNRVLRFPAKALAAGAPFPAADTVLGQPNFTTSTAGTSRTVVTTLAGPDGLTFDASGNLYVTDQAYRVMVYNIPITTGQAANAVLGVDSTVSATTPTQIALNNPLGVLFPGTGINFGPIVADTANNRLMLYAPQTNWPAQGTQFSPSAVSQIGQTSFTLNLANQGNGDASSSTFSAPVDMAASATELYVVDSGNNRVLVFPYSSTTSVTPMATRVIGQLDFPYTGPNLVDGKGFSLAGGFPAGAVLDTSATPAHLYVADTVNNRILGYKNFTALQDGVSADLVIGQPDFNRVVVNYPSGNKATPSASSLNLPTSLAVDSAGNLYVTDTGNSRVLRFPAPYASGTTSLESADLVLGQSTFTSYITDATNSTLNSPVGLALTAGAANASVTNSGFLAVADYLQNRVLLFSKPFVSGMSASIVLGQPNLTGSASSGAATGLNSPRGVAADPEDHILVADAGNARVQIFDQAAHLPNFGASPLISLTGFSLPISVGVGPSGDFWVSDYSAGNVGAMIHYPSVSALPLANDASDTSFNVIGPHSGFVDPYNNLLVTDGINRLLYFTPQVSYQNAANYSSRPLAAGTIAALYPTVTTNSIAEGTAVAPAGQFPLPINLSDTQVTVNGTPVPLYFVSPGQDNVIMPQGLPTTGSANLMVVRPSTGQILGAAEIELQSASPGLFTNPAIGSGQLLAVNFQDGSTNGANHPVVRGQFIILYGTGVGPVPNPPADGAASTGQPASDFPLVYIASSGGTTANPLPEYIPCNVTYSGLAPGFAGLWQINVQIPANAQSGSAVVLKLFEQDIPNLDQSSALTTTLAVN
jgi:uncharacterized protein (TIGR03437 family)